MKRRSFISGLLGTSTALAAMPMNTLGKIVEETPPSKYIDYLDKKVLFAYGGWLLGAADDGLLKAQRYMEYTDEGTYPGPLNWTLSCNNVMEASDHPKLLNVLIDSDDHLLDMYYLTELGNIAHGQGYITHIWYKHSPDNMLSQIELDFIGYGELNIIEELPQIEVGEGVGRIPGEGRLAN